MAPTVAADRADVLAGLLGAGLDEQRLALHLLEPPILYPLAGQPVWQGVDLLPADHYLVLDGDGRHRSVRWWTPPEPVVPMAEGAPALREALTAAVASRVRGRELVSCDLGGLDSTSVCCLAAQADAKVVAYTAASPDPLADDVDWAVRTVAGLGNVEHHVIPAEEMPLVYHGLHAMDDQLDEPCGAAVDRDRWLTIVRRAAARGSRLHLTGFGGDELLYGSVAHLHRLLRTNPRTALRHLRGFAAKYRWPRGGCCGSCRTPARTCLAGPGRRHPHRPPPPPEEPLLDWGFTPRLPPWTTPAAVQAVRDPILAEAPPPSRWPRARPAPGAGDDAVRVPHRPPVGSDGRPDRGHAGRPLLRRPGDRGRAGGAAGGADHAVAVQAADRRGDARHRPRPRA